MKTQFMTLPCSVGESRAFWNSLAFLLIAVLMVPGVVTAAENVTLEGKLEGASCVHYKIDCPDNEAHIAMEHDFVLLLPNGEHYALNNLGRITKARYALENVRISGEREGHEIWVDKLEVKEGDKYREVWSWEEQQKWYNSMGSGG